MLTRKIQITAIVKAEVISAIQNKKVLDFEDGLEDYATAAYRSDAIITGDTNDFHF